MKSGGSDNVDALDGNDGKSETNQQTPSRYDLLSSAEDEDEQDRRLLTTKLRLELDEAKRQMLTMKEESQVMQMQLRDFQAKGMSGGSSSSSSNKKNNLQQSGNVETHFGGSSNNNGGIGGGLLVCNYETTGQPIEIKSTPSANRDVALD